MLLFDYYLIWFSLLVLHVTSIGNIVNSVEDLGSKSAFGLFHPDKYSDLSIKPRTEPVNAPQ